VLGVTTVLFSLATDTVDSALLPQGIANTANAMAAAMINFFWLCHNKWLIFDEK